MLKTKLFIKYFPLDEEKISCIDERDKDTFISMFRKTEQEIISEGFYLAERGLFPIKMMFFSVARYTEILRGYEKEITSNDIDIINVVLYRNKYKFPISLFVKPILPSKYIISAM